MKLINIPSLKDNYIWILHNKKKECLIVDPGEYEPVLQIIHKLKLNIIAILLTHHHNDHTNGVYKILKFFNNIPVYGPKETIKQGTNIVVSNNDKHTIMNCIFQILSLPGHTLGHIGFYCAPWLFCGDTVFSAGCGKILEGTAQQMYNSFQKIKKLPKNTLICCAHEYTLNNLIFSNSILPNDHNILNHLNKITKLRNKNTTTLPSTLNLELKINPFFRCNEYYIKKILHMPFHSQEEWKVFAKLRIQKDKFKY